MGAHRKVIEAIPDDVQAARFLGIQRSVVAQYLRRWRNKLSDNEPEPADSSGPRTAPTATAKASS